MPVVVRVGTIDLSLAGGQQSKASREHVHGWAFDVRSLISIHLEMVLIKNVLFSLGYGGIFVNGNLADCVSPFPSVSGRFAQPLNCLPWHTHQDDERG